MERRAMKTIGLMGMLAVLGMVGLWMVSLGTVVDSTTSETSKKIYRSLKRSLDTTIEKRAAVRVTMQREGKGIEAPRHYTIYMGVSKAVGSDENATRRLLERAADILAGDLQHVEADVRISCVVRAEQPDELRVTYRRVLDGKAYYIAPENAAPPRQEPPAEPPEKPGKKPADKPADKGAE